MSFKEAEELALSTDVYELVEDLELKYKEYEVYFPSLNLDEEECMCIGIDYILSNDNETRFATREEKHDINLMLNYHEEYDEQYQRAISL